MALTETALRTAKAAGVDRKLADEKGLYLPVTVSGSKLWRLKYRIDGKGKKLALGSYTRNVTLDFSRPGKPTDNAFIERLASPAFGSTASSARNARTSTGS